MPGNGVMKSSATLLSRVAGGLLAGLMLVPALADDTELFLSNAGTLGGTSRTNVLFIIDTSGSMASEVATQAPWNPANRFSGCFDPDAVYYSANGVTPECGSENRLPKAANYCSAARLQMDRVGYYGDALLGWNEEGRRWEPLPGGATNRPLECEADRGTDGGTGSGTYAADGEGGPWDTSPDQEPTWDARYTLFDGNWLNWNASPPTVTRTRLEIVQETVNALVGSLQNVNVGIMRFNRHNGGSVIQAISPIEEAREATRSVVNGLTADDSTPLSEALYEATQYYRGGNVVYGNASPVYSVPASRTGGSAGSSTYRSPLEAACSRNVIILLTDGEPTQDTGAVNQLTPELPGFAGLTGRSQCDGSGDGACLDDLAEYLYKADLDPLTDGQQNVITHTIGFQLDLPLLAETARRGGGQYYLVDDTATLATALSGIVLSVYDSASSFAAPAVPVNAFNRGLSAGDVYLSVFAPSERARWPGNLKKYRVAGGELVGRDGEPVLDPVTGFFNPGAWSFWSSEPDGGEVRRGGAASRLPEWSGRRLYTDVAGENLGSTANRVSTGNTTGITAERLGVPAAERENVIEWALGRDVRDEDLDGDSNETRRDMGDPLHVQPVTVTYGGTADSPDTLVFLATNDGYLHAFDGEDGSERWAYVPGELLPRLYTLYRNEPVAARTYGLDGELELHIQNDDGRPGISGNERALLLFGMGRGGRSVYALDVTNPAAPTLRWRVRGGDPGFEDLGQTWSRPQVIRVDTGSGPREVVLFSGGYDSGQDGSTYRTDSVGNALYLVDLDTGSLIWSAGHATRALGDHNLKLERMEHSIPAAPRVVDLNQDGLADRFYVGDTGGRLWRFDIANGQSNPDLLVEGGLLATLGAADLGASPPATAIRRFYETPDVVPLVRGGQLVLTINLGSGHRGHPLETGTEDAFFSVRDFRPLAFVNRSQYGNPVTVGQLDDITTNPAPSLPVDSPGWMLRMVEGDGEKILGESLTIQGNVFFTSFTPEPRVSACISSFGVSRLYQVSILDGSPLTNLDTSTSDLDLTVEDRFVELPQASLGLEPVLLITGPEGTSDGTEGGQAGGSITICVGGQCRTLAPGSLIRTYWFEDQRG
jgi:type IV pilus assembly protein PilY1